MEKLQVSTVRSEKVTELENPMNQCCSHLVRQEGIVLYFAASALEQVLEHLSTFSASTPYCQEKCHLGKVDFLLFIHGIQAEKHLRLS